MLGGRSRGSAAAPAADVDVYYCCYGVVGVIAPDDMDTGDI